MSRTRNNVIGILAAVLVATAVAPRRAWRIGAPPPRVPGQRTGRPHRDGTRPGRRQAWRRRRCGSQCPCLTHANRARRSRTVARRARRSDEMDSTGATRRSAPSRAGARPGRPSEDSPDRSSALHHELARSGGHDLNQGQKERAIPRLIERSGAPGRASLRRGFADMTPPGPTHGGGRVRCSLSRDNAWGDAPGVVGHWRQSRCGPREASLSP